MASFSDYTVFIDESGDHSLVKVDPDFPIFVLSFIIVHKDVYANEVVPAVKRLKFRFWGHDAAILHSHEIRKPRGDFAFLQVREMREAFLDGLNTLVADADVTVVSVAIRKDELTARYRRPFSPYHIALEMGLERVSQFLIDHGQENRLTHLIAEARGDNEDQDLELEFRRVMDGKGRLRANLEGTPFELRIESKKCNSEGMQLADLVAYPIARRVLKPEQQNRAFDILEPKLMRGDRGDYDGFGLKVFPQ